MPEPTRKPSEDHWAAPLYDERAAELVLYGRALGLSHSEAEDVLHDVFRALLGLENPPQQPHHYVVRAFRNRALNFRRGFLRRVLRELESSRWFDSHPDEGETERQAMKALAGLPSDQREVIVLKIWHGLTFETIGGLLSISPNTAAGRYRYGLQKLRQSVSKESHELNGHPGEPSAWLTTQKTFRET